MLGSTANNTPRDYRLDGPNAVLAIEKGMASAEWYHSEISRKVMKDLMKRRDAPAIRDTIIWVLGLVLCAAGGIYFWGSFWAIPFFAVYGVLYGSACDARWHECGHGTAFRTRWMNQVVYHVASFMFMRNPVNTRWSHVRHHTDTVIVGRDPEIVLMRPTAIASFLLRFVGVVDVYKALRTLLNQSLGRFTPAERDYVPEHELLKATFWARIHIAIYAATLLLALVYWTILPLILIGGPRIYGCWHTVLTSVLQHGGLAEDVPDHRLNSRTVLMNPISRWIYLNMNYHVEHHMFPMVPYFALPRLHEAIKHDLPPPNTSMFDAYREVLGAIWKQRRDVTYYHRKKLPITARPFREEFHVPEIARL